MLSCHVSCIFICKMRIWKYCSTYNSNRNFYDADMIYPYHRGSSNILEAMTKGMMDSARICISVVVALIIYLALGEFISATLVWFGDRVDVGNFTFEVNLSIEFIKWNAHPALLLLCNTLPPCIRTGNVGVSLHAFKIMVIGQQGNGAIRRYLPT